MFSSLKQQVFSSKVQIFGFPTYWIVGFILADLPAVFFKLCHGTQQAVVTAYRVYKNVSTGKVANPPKMANFDPPKTKATKKRHSLNEQAGCHFWFTFSLWSIDYFTINNLLNRMKKKYFIEGEKDIFLTRLHPQEQVLVIGNIFLNRLRHKWKRLYEKERYFLDPSSPSGANLGQRRHLFE